MPRISVCIPTYESELTLGRAIESVLNQAGVDVEMIIGDNASKDNTRIVVEAFDADCIRYFRHDTNIGYPANVNSCLKRASGEFVFILCADDFLIHDGVLTELLSELKANPHAVASHLPFQLYQQAGETCSVIGHPFSPLKPGVHTTRSVFGSFTEGKGCFGWGWLFRRDLIERHNLRFEIDHDMAPDTMFWLTISMTGLIVEVTSNRAGYAFVMHKDNLGGRLFNKHALEVYEQLVTFEKRVFERLRRQVPEVADELSHRQYRYSACEFSGLVQKAVIEKRLRKIQAINLLGHAANRHPRAAINMRFVRNLIFIMLPSLIQRSVLLMRAKNLSARDINQK